MTQPIDQQKLVAAVISQLGTALQTQTSALTAAAHDWLLMDSVKVVFSTGSTNTDLYQQAQAQRGTPLGPRRSLLAARWQSAGRGRRGRAWLAEPDAALMFSIGLQLDCPAARLAGFTLLCGLAARDALAAHGVSVSLKWPNDLVVPTGLASHAKLGGILVEALPNPESTSTFVVAGFGINRAMSHATRSAIGSPAIADLNTLGGGHVDPNGLIADIVLSVERRLPSFLQHGFACMTDEFDAAHCWHRQTVRLSGAAPELSKEGMFAGVGANGEACLIDAQGVVSRHYSGELSLRLADESVLDH